MVDHIFGDATEEPERPEADDEADRQVQPEILAPDEARGMIVKAYVVVAPSATADDALATALQEHVKREIAPYKYPRAIKFVTQLPKTETGKLKRFALRRAAQAEATSPGVAAE